MEIKKKVEKEKRLPLQIDNYNDLFSDFDPRPFEHRALSIDFLDEGKRAVRDKGEGVELKFFIPEKERNIKDERIIKKRLLNHFQRHHELIARERKLVINRGLSFLGVGIILMFIATFVLFKYEKSALTSFLIILLEPASWFLFWEGLNQTIFESKRFKSDLEFYRKMSKASIEFVNH